MSNKRKGRYVIQCCIAHNIKSYYTGQCLYDGERFIQSEYDVFDEDVRTYPTYKAALNAIKHLRNVDPLYVYRVLPLASFNKESEHE